MEEKQKNNYFNVRFISLRGRNLIRLPVVIKVDFASFFAIGGSSAVFCLEISNAIF